MLRTCPRFGVLRNLARKIAALFLSRLRIIDHETVRSARCSENDDADSVAADLHASRSPRD